MSTQTVPSPLASPTFAELFTPKLVTVFREGYRLGDFRTDLIAGLTVAIVALPSRWRSRSARTRPRRGVFTPRSLAASCCLS